MKIIDIKTFLLRAPLKKPFESSTMKFDTRNSLLVKVETDIGINGWGEAGQFGPKEPPRAVIENVLKPLLIGKDPRRTDELWNLMYSHTRDFGQKGPIIEGISGIDIALWDIKGKSFNVPIFLLLGAKYRDSVFSYATGLYFKRDQTIDDYIQEAQEMIKKGFGAIKVKIGSRHLKEDIRIIAALREELGDEVLIMCDANHSYNAFSAIKMGEELKKYDIYWLEEPVIPEDIEGYCEVKNKLNGIAIAGGECEFTPYGFLNLIKNRAVDILQPDISVTGGFTACKKIVDLAELFGIKVVPHIWGSAVSMFASLNLIAYVPDIPPTGNPYPSNNQTLFEYDQSENPLREGFVKEYIHFEKGWVSIPQKPGLGLEIDEGKIKNYLS